MSFFSWKNDFSMYLFLFFFFLFTIFIFVEIYFGDHISLLVINARTQLLLASFGERERERERERESTPAARTATWSLKRRGYDSRSALSFELREKGGCKGNERDRKWGEIIRERIRERRKLKRPKDWKGEKKRYRHVRGRGREKEREREREREWKYINTIFREVKVEYKK